MSSHSRFLGLIAFLGVFVASSAFIGWRVIGSGLVERDGFQVYGGAGKALLFGALCLVILVHRKGLTEDLRPWSALNAIWLPMLLAVGLAWYGAGKLVVGHTPMVWLVLVHISLFAIVVLAALCVFGPRNLVRLTRVYARELLISVGLGAAFYGYLAVVYGLWRVLADGVLRAVSYLLPLAGISVTLTPQHTLILKTFGVDVAKYCSGIESIALFTALYVLVGVLDWHRLDHPRLFSLLVPALVVLFGLNIFRVFILIVAAYYIDRTLALSLFHTYAAMILFIAYTALFWKVTYGWMLASSRLRPV